MMTRKIIGVTGCLVWFCCAGANGEDGMNYDDVKLSLAVPKTVHLGSDILFALSLDAEKEQSACSVATADLVMTVQDLGDPEKKYVCQRGRLREVTKQLDDGSRFSKTLKVEKHIIQVGKGASSSASIGMLEGFNTRLPCGTYAVSAVYEGKVEAMGRFSVVLDYERTVPALIDLTGGTDEWTRGWARDHLFAIIGQPAWKPSRADTRERIDAEVAALRDWWEVNEDLVLLVESRSRNAEKLMQGRN